MIDAARKMLVPIGALNRRVLVGAGMLAFILLSEGVGQISYLA